MRFTALHLIFLSAAFGQATITDSGSTNRSGMSITVGSKGRATVRDQQGNNTEITLPAELQKRFMHDLESAPPLNEIKAVHCMKSVSFGSSTFITYKGVRSPDLSCGQQGDASVAALQKDIQEIMAQTHSATTPNSPAGMKPLSRRY